MGREGASGGGYLLGVGVGPRATSGTGREEEV